MIIVRIRNNNLADAQRAAAQFGQAECAMSPRRSGEVICALPCTLEGRRRVRRAFASGAAGVVWFDDRCPVDLKGARHRHKGGRRAARRLARATAK